MCFSNEYWLNKCKERCFKCKRYHQLIFHRDTKPSQGSEAQQSPTIIIGSKYSTSVLVVAAVVLVRDVCWDVEPVKALLT